MRTKQTVLTCLCVILYIVISLAAVLYNKWVLSVKYFNFPFPITLAVIQMAFRGSVAFIFVHVFKVRFIPLKSQCPFKICFALRRSSCGLSTSNINSERYTKPAAWISAFVALKLWSGDTACLHISVPLIQMLKTLCLGGVVMYHCLTNREIQGAKTLSDGFPTPKRTARVSDFFIRIM
ncbi:hypothetical protein CDL15_Pgr000839 [Punica granatum]|uniref:Sugar phosphate transporter domain-containing protein n=1 Tax=Punica granatum TaxID=22663 RepID=A0A218W3G8_PUNGR|nr:hypothetical protein CDL15_Pgr000839 [Punica granatum]